MSEENETTGDPNLDLLRAEVERAAGYYYNSPQQRGIDNRTKRFVIERCEPHLKGPRVLELGYVDGEWTQVILQRGFQVDVVEGAAAHVEHARTRFHGCAGVRVFHSLFQELKPDCAYDCIIAGDMLRYLEEPTDFLRTARAWLKDDGVLIATMPNSRSLHRRVGALMGLEGSPGELNDRDREVGNRRTYDRYELKTLLESAGLHVRTMQGCFLKPVSSAQMEGWDDALLRAFLLLGDELADYCWFLYAICRKS
jgi:2-polyprenyl-3-methyl-5-hydroxy-6-metoxy-1,4-benzoquinol methylase